MTRTEKFVTGRQFTLRTDHGSLVWVKKLKEPEGQLAQWLERFEEYDFSVLHRRGSQHNNADALSRVPCKQCGRSSYNAEAEESTAVGLVTGLPFQIQSVEEMRDLQLKDPIIKPVYSAVRGGKQPSSDEPSVLGRENKWLLQQWDSLCMKNGLLWRKDLEDRNVVQLILPYSLHDAVFGDLHEGAVGGHLGEGKMLGRLKERFYWPGCSDAVGNWIKGCVKCATRKMSVPKQRANLQTL